MRATPASRKSRGTSGSRTSVSRTRGREDVLRGIDLEVPAGKTVGLVGATGSGKTTLVRLLLRFHDPLEGKVSLDGHDVRTLKLDSLRGSISLVSQTTTLFPGLSLIHI